MAELHSNIYFKHADLHTHKNLINLFESFSKDRASILKASTLINPESGSTLATTFLDKVKNDFNDAVDPESIWQEGDFHVAHLVNGGSGHYIAGNLVKFINELCQGVHCQGWGCGDDDPWEYWFKYQDGRVIRCDDEPYMDGNDAWTKSTVYRWWHEDMPENIKAGFLNEDDEEDSELEGEPASDDEYQNWLSDLINPSDSQDASNKIDQGIEPALAKEDVKKMMGAIGELFSMFKSSSKSSKNPQEKAFECEQITETLVREAFEDINKHERDFDLDGVLKHYSKTLKCISNSIDENLGHNVSIPMSYGLFRMGLLMILKPEAHYESASQIKSFELLDDGTASLDYETKTKFLDPETKKMMLTRTEDRMIWSIQDRKLQVVELICTEIEKEFLD
jgi:hypothetical protein